MEEPLFVDQEIDADISQRLGDALPAVEVLAFVVRLYRPMRERDRAPVIGYMRCHVDLAQYPDEVLYEWIKVHRVGWYREVSGFERFLANLEMVPTARREEVRGLAYKIAGGTGRKPMHQRVIDELMQFFPADLGDPGFDPALAHQAVWRRKQQEAEEYDRLYE
ncbi:hypothetical protein [Crenobacter cavernae]|uniref:Uncharacterized protein n=1 Tax=Crenobacter cavernae TaxID=2290923 RepID=A0A345Y6T4_9NEIS|nr:hypothetical protein [Crenobacter cavernae]AXK39636.1 hypothetical protein DWG20_09370 [Crenobacter cavernae]